MPHSAKTKAHPKEVKRKEKLSDKSLLELVQRQTFLYFWHGAEPVSGLARDRVGRLADPADHDVAMGGSGFGVMAMIVACERGWVTRADALARLSKALDCLERAFEDRDFLIRYIHLSPALKSLNGHPRFKAILRKMGLNISKVSGSRKRTRAVNVALGNQLAG